MFSWAPVAHSERIAAAELIPRVAVGRETPYVSMRA
jgi:hypothetical protein